MYSKEELEKLAKSGREKLKSQEVGKEEDIYAEFREEFEEVKGENIYLSNNEKSSGNENVALSHSTTEEDHHVKLRHQMNDEEYEDSEDIYSEAKIENSDEYIYPGGPTVLEIEGWKKKYKNSSVYIVDVSDEVFVFRTLNRFEYKQLIRQANLDASQREEIICETTVLHPYEYNWRAMAKKDAGIPSTLSQIIMTKSGFTDEYRIEKL